MKEAYEALLARILDSPYFNKAPALSRVVKYICRETGGEERTSLNEYEIAVNVLDRRESFDPKIDPIVRVNIANIRDRLDSYFKNEGSQESVRLLIPKGEYRAVFYEAESEGNLVEREQIQSPALEKFWQPYLIGSPQNQLVISELLFMGNPQGTYVRNIFCNDPHRIKEALEERLAYFDSDQFAPSYHYVSAGEMHCSLSLIHLFANLGVRLEPVSSRSVAWRSLSQSNLILIGSARTNPFVDALQGDENWIMREKHIENRHPRRGEPAEYVSQMSHDGKMERLIEYAVVTRRPGIVPSQVVTIITANHGRAIEGAGRYVTSDAYLAYFLDRVQADRGSERIPERFQVLVQVALQDHGQEVADVDYVAHRIF